MTTKVAPISAGPADGPAPADSIYTGPAGCEDKFEPDQYASCESDCIDSGDTSLMMMATTFVMLQTPAMGIAQAVSVALHIRICKAKSVVLHVHVRLCAVGDGPRV